MRQGSQYTVNDFHAQNPLHLLIMRLRAGGFGRGLPVDKELANPSVVAFFRTLIRNGEVEEGVENHETLHECHRNGWIHGYMTSSDPPVIRYTFSSPFHSAVVSWPFHLRVTCLFTLPFSHYVLQPSPISNLLKCISPSAVLALRVPLTVYLNPSIKTNFIDRFSLPLLEVSAFPLSLQLRKGHIFQVLLIFHSRSRMGN